MKRQRQRRGTDFEIIEIPQEFFELGRRRTENMLKWQASRATLHDLVANAYLQGVQDGYEARERRAIEQTVGNIKNGT